MVYRFAMLILVFTLVSDACTQRVQQRFCEAEDVQRLPESYALNKAQIYKRCSDALSYTTNSERIHERPIRYIRTNFHIINTSSGKHNFQEKEAIRYIKDLVSNANSDLKENAKVKLPENNDIPVLPTQFRIKIASHIDKPKQPAIYFHKDDSLCFYVHKGKNRNLFNRDIIKKYAIQKDSVINVFVMPHHPDSVASKTYHAGGVGVALGTNMKLAGMYESGKPFWHFRMVLNHELGHIFGLQHAWTRHDGCEDTPVHANCWSKGAKSGCDGVVSNNMMDYNAHQKALTPCQIGRVHKKMSRIGSKTRDMLEPTWCELDVEKSVFIQDSVEWLGARDLEGHVVIQNGGVLRIACRLSMPKASKITLEEGATLIIDNAQIHNACGDKWQGIELLTRGKQKGTIQMLGEARLEDVEHKIAE